jgi:Spy/CpxP family protein refolding chaperone
MSKTLIRLTSLVAAAVAGLALSAAAQAQPMSGPHGLRAEPPHMRPHHAPKHKVWVPAHREHGRMVRGHYAMR